MKKRLGTFLLALTLFLTLIPTTTYAVDTESADYTNTPADAVDTEFADYTGEATDAPVNPGDGADTLAEAGEQLREAMCERRQTVTVHFSASSRVTSPAATIYQEAIRHTGVPTEGDYLRFQCGGWSAEIGYVVYTGNLYYTVKYNMRYYTTAANEQAVTDKVHQVLRSLSLDNADSYTKVRAIYDYICRHVSYDYANLTNSSYLLKYSCYAALNNGTAVCQGYSLLFYRLALECGLDTRIVVGMGNGAPHSWNIVRLGGKYYNLDSTWDAGRSTYLYFLKGESFSSHTRDTEYRTDSFQTAYPMSSADYSVKMGETPLPAPTVTASCNASSGKPTLSWNAVGGAAEYEIYRATSLNGTYSKMYSTANTGYTNTGADVGRTYYYKVRAISSSGTAGNFSSVKSVTCDCARPTVSIACNTTSGKPRLSWSAVSGATEYYIYRSTDGTDYSFLYSTSATSYTNTSATAGNTYYYKVKAVSDKSSAATSAYSTAKSIVCDCARPNVTVASNATTGKPVLCWSAVRGADKYYIYRSTNGTDFSYYSSTANTSYTNTSVTVGTTYYYKVKAVSNKSSYATSAYSEVKSIVCDCARPVVSITLSSSGKPRLSWNAVSGADKYYIYRSTDGTNFSYLYSTTGTSFTNTGAAAGKTYYYKVKALSNKSSYATSTYSTAVHIKTAK